VATTENILTRFGMDSSFHCLCLPLAGKNAKTNANIFYKVLKIAIIAELTDIGYFGRKLDHWAFPTRCIG